MTVKEFRKFLKTMPPSADVVFEIDGKVAANFDTEVVDAGVQILVIKGKS